MTKINVRELADKEIIEGIYVLYTSFGRKLPNNIREEEKIWKPGTQFCQNRIPAIRDLVLCRLNTQGLHFLPDDLFENDHLFRTIRTDCETTAHFIPRFSPIWNRRSAIRN